MAEQVSLNVNGRDHLVDVEPEELLVDVLRDRLGLTGAKKGCGTGDCGACTVLLGGRAVSSCLVLALSVGDRPVLTIEGLASGGRLHPLQQSFLAHGAVQCGYCTPGMVMSALELLSDNPAPTEEEVRVGIAGNLCRCTGYQKVVEAILAAADEMRDLAHE
jgi:aerobic-type carbon monoxide dehydrogenase small subunit (CoxS/CutS family)